MCENMGWSGDGRSMKEPHDQVPRRGTVTRRHPSPVVLSRYGRRVMEMLDDQGATAIQRARLLAARGWPASVSGDGSRSSDTTSSTERAALNPGQWDGIDKRLEEQMRLAWYVLTQLESTVVWVMAHASDDDPLPAGTGTCERCNRFCRPDADHPDNRIKSGFCYGVYDGQTCCYNQWVRQGRPERSGFIRTYKSDAA